MSSPSRRALLGALPALPLLCPSLVAAQSRGGPIKVGLLSDVGGPYQDNGGPGNKVAVELALADFGGSVLGRPLLAIQADNQNKPDLASSIAREWVDNQDVSLLLDGASSAAALAIQQVSREKKRIYCSTTSIATALIGRQCSPYSFQFMANAHALARGVGGALTEQGKDTWFFITVDNEGGTSLQSSAEMFIRPAGGRILGSVRAPVGTADFSSYIVRARSSGAKVVGLANAGVDLQTCIKQAAEFGVTRGGQLLATLVLEINDVLSIGQDSCRGLVLTTPFYWNMSAESRSWSERYAQRMRKPPGSGQASAYSATMHWLKAVQATGTLDADAVAPAMRAMPLRDFFNEDVRILANGSVPHSMYLWVVKPAAEAEARWDAFRLIGTLPSPQAFPPADAFGCTLV